MFATDPEFGEMSLVDCRSLFRAKHAEVVLSVQLAGLDTRRDRANTHDPNISPPWRRETRVLRGVSDPLRSWWRTHHLR